MSARQTETLLRQAAATSDPDLMVQAGAAAMQSGCEQQALAAALPIAEQHPQDWRVWLLVGLLYRTLDQLASALAALDRAEQLNPDYALVASSIAYASFEAGFAAVDKFERAIALAPRDHSLALGLAAALASEGRRERAIEVLEGRLAANPLWFAGHARLARLRWSSGDGGDLTRSFETALDRHPENLELWQHYLDTLQQAGLHDEVRAAAERGRATLGENPAFDAAEAVSLSNAGDNPGAERLFERLARFRDVGVAEHRVRHLLRSGRTLEAGALAERMLHVATDDRFWPYLSLAWRLTGDPRWEWLEGDEALVGVVDIAGRMPPLGELAGVLRSVHRDRSQPLDQSVRGGTQTQGHLLARAEPAIVQLRAAIVEAIGEYVKKLPEHRPGHPLLGRSRGPIRFAGSWTVRLTGGGHHIDHFHPAGWISSALYVSLPDGVAGSAGQKGWLTLGEASELNVAVDPIRAIEPAPGRLVLFPSTMWHGTRPFDAGERLTISFDVGPPPSLT